MGTPVTLLLIVLLQLFTINQVESQICSYITWKFSPVRVTYWRTYMVTQNKPDCLFNCEKITTIRSQLAIRRVDRLVSTRMNTCCAGYMQDRHSFMLSCKSMCSEPCINGYCKGPEQCGCKSGYIPDPNNQHNCLSLGDTHPCSNETNIESNTCQCGKGHRLVDGMCFPVCSEPCVGGTCVAPDVCECWPGYDRTGPNVCVPHCTNCSHGRCLGPEHCICDPGYDKTSIGETMTIRFSSCQPICTKPCVNSTCIAPDTCQCLPGYKLGGKNTCTPHCSDCSHGSCVEPETCVCDSGFKMTQINGTTKTSCQPICTKPCINGTCTVPDICECLPGYTKRGENTCSPHCSSCSHGTCIAPETCVWNSGWKVTQINGSMIISCDPICTKACVNGTCIAPETCKCLDGYKETSENTCAPHCASCVNGNCVGPETCICNTGWEITKINGTISCQPICSKPCVQHSTCVAPQTCKCFDGYKLSKNLVCELHVPAANVTNIDSNVTNVEQVDA